MHVEFLNADGELIGRVKLQDGFALPDLEGGFDPTVNHVYEPGDPPKLLMPGDGERYLRALPVNYGSAYCRAVLHG